jgi:hypothetical protein
MSDDLTTCTATVAIAEVEIAGASSAVTAVTHVAIEAHPAGAHGASHDLLAPVVSHAPEGTPEDASLTATAFDTWAPCGAPWLIWFAGASPMAAMASADIPWSPCMRQSEPLASNESWRSSALESTAVRRWRSEKRVME